MINYSDLNLKGKYYLELSSSDFKKYLPKKMTPTVIKKKRLGVELHDWQDEEGSQVPGQRELHADGGRRPLPRLLQGQRDVGLRYVGFL